MQQIGVFFQSDAAHAITKAILAITDDGRVVVFWTESTVDSAHASVIKAAWVDWTTYLAVTDPDFILPPTSFSLSAFPNPFNARTVIRFTLPERANVSLDIFDLSGRKTAELAHGAFEAGEHSLVFDASDKPSGVYFVTMEAGKQQVSQKILLLK